MPSAQTLGGLGRSKNRAVQAGRTEVRSDWHISDEHTLPVPRSQSSFRTFPFGPYYV